MSRHYKNAPISEAVIDLRVDLSAEVPVNMFRALANRVADRLPVSSPISMIEMGFQKDAASPAQFYLTDGDVGIRLQSRNGDRVLQAQRAGFTYSHMAPYTTWRQFRAEAKDLWSQFVAETSAEHITRAAVRVINKIDLPVAPSDIKEYVTLFPTHPGGPFSFMQAFYMQLQLKLDEEDAIINVAYRPSTGTEKSGLILDIDLFIVRGVDLNDVWASLDRLSERKNEVFETCITDKTREIIS